MITEIAIQKRKTQLRAAVKERLAALTTNDFTSAGIEAAKKIADLPGWNTYNSILIFISMKDEINTEPLIKTIRSAKKLLFIPHVNGNMLYFYHYGIEIKNAEPKPDSICGLHSADFPVLVITPGIAFDKNCNRLGRGRGYYDRFFAELDKSGCDYTALGLCMECQLVGEVPVENGDKKMDGLIVPNL